LRVFCRKPEQPEPVEGIDKLTTQIDAPDTAVFMRTCCCIQLDQLGSAFGISGKLSIFPPTCLCVLGKGCSDINLV